MSLRPVSLVALALAVSSAAAWAQPRATPGSAPSAGPASTAAPRARAEPPLRQPSAKPPRSSASAQPTVPPAPAPPASLDPTTTSSVSLALAGVPQPPQRVGPRDRWWDDVEPEPSSEVSAPLVTTGWVLVGLGAGTIFAASITWLLAATEASRLDDECPDNQCVVGTRGGDALEAARDLTTATQILVGVGAPVLTVGVVMAALGAATGSSHAAVRVMPTGTGLVVDGRF